MGSANQPYVNFFFIKKFQSLISGLAGNADPHLGMRQDIGLQPGEEEHIGRAWYWFRYGAAERFWNRYEGWHVLLH